MLVFIISKKRLVVKNYVKRVRMNGVLNPLVVTSGRAEARIHAKRGATQGK